MITLKQPLRHQVVACAMAAAIVIDSAWRSPLPTIAAQAPDWPPVTSGTRPWTRWWWMGSAVDPAGLTSELESLREAGIGGVEITPIYGAAGSEPRFVTYLSADWMRLLDHTLREAGRLGLGVDMATGTGWPFGGPWVSEREAPRTLAHRTWTVNGGQRLAEAVRAEQPPMVRAVGTTIHEVVETAADRAARAPGSQPAARPGARRIDIADVREPVETTPNLQALALEQMTSVITSRHFSDRRRRTRPRG